MKILVSGFTGTLGSALVPLLLDEGHDVVGYSRCELKQSQFPVHERLTKYIGDVRDRDRLVEASRDCDYVFHLAALKRIEVCEENPDECVATNLVGTMNVLHAQRLNKIPRVILSSTDKAVYPINTYGMSKATAERLVMRNPENVVCRWGNVFGSRGSVLSMFARTIREGEAPYINITDKRMTRFWITVDDAAAFMWLAAQKPEGGLYIPKMKAYPVVKVGCLVGKILGKDVRLIRDIGMRPQEKLHEHLRRGEEGGEIVSDDQSIWFKPSEIEEILRPILESI